MSDVRYELESRTQILAITESDEYFTQTKTGLVPFKLYSFFDIPSNENYGPFMSRGTLDFVAGCVNNVRNSQINRAEFIAANTRN